MAGQARYAAGRREILECWFNGRPIRNEYLIVEDNLAALRVLVQEAEQQQRAVAAAQESLQLFTNRYQGGVDTYLQVITAQTLAPTNERNAVDILRRRTNASVLLIKALGGGWHVANLPQF